MTEVSTPVAGKTFLVSGGTSGVGGAIATGIAKLGGKVVVISRSDVGGKAAVRSIAAATGNDAAEFLVGDLSDLASIDRLAAEFKSRFERLDVLANCAGAVVFKKSTTHDGLDRSFVLNYLGHFALTRHLMDILSAGASSRVITVAGNPRFLAKPDIDDEKLEGKSDYSAMGALSQAMFARTHFAFELARRVAGTGVSSIAFHPGLVKSRLLSDAPALFRAFGFVSNMLAKDTSASGVYVATSAELADANGKFIDDKCTSTELPNNFDPDVGARLWEISEDLLRTRGSDPVDA